MGGLATPILDGDLDPHWKGHFWGYTWEFPDLPAINRFSVISLVAEVMWPVATSTVAACFVFVWL